MKHSRNLTMLLATLMATTFMSEKTYASDDVGCMTAQTVNGVITELAVGASGFPVNQDGNNGIWVKLDDGDWFAVDPTMNLNDQVGPSMLSMLQLAYTTSMSITLHSHDNVCSTFSEIKFNLNN